MADNIPDYMKRVVGWDKTTTRLGETQEELPHLADHRVQLEGISQQYKGLGDEYATVCARKLEAQRGDAAGLPQGPARSFSPSASCRPPAVPVRSGRRLRSLPIRFRLPSLRSSLS